MPIVKSSILTASKLQQKHLYRRKFDFDHGQSQQKHAERQKFDFDCKQIAKKHILIARNPILIAKDSKQHILIGRNYVFIAKFRGGTPKVHLVVACAGGRATNDQICTLYVPRQPVEIGQI